MFLTQLTRCHCADSHCSAVTSRQPGNLVQSGSTNSRRRYSWGWPTVEASRPEATSLTGSPRYFPQELGITSSTWGTLLENFLHTNYHAVSFSASHLEERQ